MAYETQAEGKSPDLKALRARWLAEIEAYEREAGPWIERGRKILKLYKDSDNRNGRAKRFNVLWSNVQTLLPALYARDPKPEIERRHKDKDALARIASEVLERCVSFTIAEYGFGRVMRKCVLDRLLPGRGVPWVRYEPQFVDGQLVGEKVCVDYVQWEDFGHNVARFWEEVTCVWKKVYLNRAQLVKAFGEELGNKIPLDHTPKGGKDDTLPEHQRKACIYEGVDREVGAVWFLSKSYDELLRYEPDPLRLNGGFPVPEPLFATLTSDSLIPVPDYALYQTQAMELENLTARIYSLQKALKVAGVYDSSAPGLQQLLNDTVENKLIPVERWAAFGEKGGLKASIDFLPIREVGEVLIGLYEAREKSKQDLYEITGIADIIRGNSEPNETATAQQIKGRFAVLRIADSQQDVQRLARDTIRLVTEIIAEHFSLDTIRSMSGVELLTEEEKAALLKLQQMGQQIPAEKARLLNQPTWEQVHALISHDVARDFRIDIETDSTIRMDEVEERQGRIEFLAAASNFIRSAAEAPPAMLPLAGELLMFGVRGFKTARQLEPAFEEAIQALQQAAQQPQQDPEMAKVQAQVALEREKAQLQAQLEREKAQLAAQQEAAVQAAQSQQEAERQQMANAKAERDAQREAELKRYEAELRAQLEREKQQMERETAIVVERIKAESAERVAAIQAEFKARETERKLAAVTEARRLESQEKAAEREHEIRADSEKTSKLVNAASEITRALEELKKLKGKMQ